MTRVAWHERGQRPYESGIDRGVLYPSTGPGLSWSGLVSVDELEDEADFKVRYFNGRRYHQRSTPGNFAAKVTAYFYPEMLNARESFGFSYRTGRSEHHLIHLIYDAVFTPTDRSYSTVNGDVDITPLVWNITTRPSPLVHGRRASHLVIDTSSAHSWVLDALDKILYGDSGLDPRLPSPDEVLELFESNSLLRIIDHGDGTWTATGPDEAIQMLDADTFQISWPSAVYISEDTYVISSL